MANPFEKILVEMAAGIPPRFLAALAQRESSFDAKAVTGHAVGLFQITPVVLNDYNAHHSTSYQQPDLFDPILNTRLAVDHLHRIIELYATIPALQPDWSDRRWVELLVLGWNAGHGGVVRVVRQMVRAGVTPERTTVDTVHTAALALQHPGHLGDEKHVRFARRVAATYFGTPEAPPQVAVRGAGAATAVGLLAPIGALALGNAVLHAGIEPGRGRKS